MKKGWKIGISIAVVAAIAGGGFLLFGSGGKAASSTTYSTMTIGTGDLEKSVSGTGTLAIADTQEIVEGFDVTADKIAVSVGQSVKKGDLLLGVDAQAISDTITTLESSLASLDSQLNKIEDSSSTTQTVKSTIEGRIKAIYAKEGDYTTDVINAKGALMVVSLDGKMKVQIANSTLALGDTVSVVDGSYTYTGTVEQTDGKNATITFSDATTAVDATVTVKQDGNTLGTGKAAVNKPVQVTGTAGTISDLYVSLNRKVYSGTSLYYLKNVPESDQYASLMDQRDTAYETLQAARQIKQNGGIVAAQDGIVSAVNAVAGQKVTAGTALASLYVGDTLQMDVQIDELDITNVKVGQSAKIAMDAITGKTYEGEVTAISEIGTTSSGVTTYGVTVKVAGDESLKIGMNGTATIVVEQRTGVVLVPLIALQTSKGQQYVWVKDSTTNESTGTPGKMTAVTTGLSNDTYAEVTSGLSAGDEIVVVRSASSSSSNANGKAMNIMEFGGGEIGGFQRPNGSNLKSNTNSSNSNGGAAASGGN